MKKVLVIYHSRDLDGWMSAAILKEYIFVSALGQYDTNNVKFLGWDYGDDVPVDDLITSEIVIIVDITLPSLFMKRLHDEGKLIWIDHHKSSIKTSIEEGYDSCPGIRDTKLAACELTWIYYFGEPVPTIVEMLGKYDSFRMDTDFRKVLVFQYGARPILHNMEEAYDALSNPRTWENINNVGKYVYEYVASRAKELYATHVIGTFKDIHGNIHHIPVVSDNRLNIKNFNVDNHPYPAFACFWLRSSGLFEFSIYSTSELDVSEIALAYSGGGHAGASGFICDINTVTDILYNEG